MPPKRLRKRAVTIEDLTRIRFLRSVALSPDEESVCFALETVADDRKKYASHLWRCAIDGSNLEQLTFGKRNDASPAFSPDGRWIAFVSKRGDHPGIHLPPTGGGEARPLVEKDGTFTSVSFSPDSQTIVCAFRANDPIPDKDEKPEKDGKPPKREPPVCRHVTRLAYREDAVGFYPRDRFHIWAFDVETGNERQLTRGRFDEITPTISTDGRLVAFVSNIRPDPDRDSLYDDLFLVPLAGGRVRRVRTPAGPVSMPSFSPDGRRIAYHGHTDPEGPWHVTPGHVWIVGTSGRPAALDMTPSFDRESIDLTISDSGQGYGFPAPHWSPDGRSVTYLVSDTGATLVYRLTIRDRRPVAIVRGQMHVQAIAYGRRGRRAAILYGPADAPAEIGIIDLTRRNSRPRQITDLNRDWLKTVMISKPQEVWFDSTDRKRVQGWVLKPPNFRRGRRYPAIVEVHGGPRMQYGYTFFHEMQVLAARGYVVFYCNPRGSQGRGAAWSGAIVNRWGTVDYEDVMAGTDWLEAQRYIDPKRIGVTGGSYGGYMTNWLVGHTRRYKAAVTQRSVVSLESFFGSSDFGFAWKREFGAHPWEDPENYKRMSPLTYARNIRTPLLIIHSENDQRCGIEQAEQLFATLKMLRRTTEFVRFPQEPHGLSRHGRPDRRIARLEHILRWFDKYMKRR